jgi:hypothetical protein
MTRRGPQRTTASKCQNEQRGTNRASAIYHSMYNPFTEMGWEIKEPHGLHLLGLGQGKTEHGPKITRTRALPNILH